MTELKDMIEPHKEIVNGCEFLMLPVGGGIFNMGDEQGDLLEACLPVHQVKVADFYIGKYPVTQGLWMAVMNGENQSEFKGDDRPVERVSWNGINQKFLPALRKLTGVEYRLPTEAEWEYAARGGKYYTEGCKYAGSDRLKDVGWFGENSGNETKPVGQKNPNQLGLYDMSGNVWEWCEDHWHGNYEGAPKNGSAWVYSPELDTRCVGRGGGWLNDARYCRVALRVNFGPDGHGNFIGFRLALSLK